MTESKTRAEVRALVRRATAFLAQQAMIEGDYLEHVLGAASVTLDAGSKETRKIIADEIAYEIGFHQGRSFAPKTRTSPTGAEKEVAP